MLLFDLSNGMEATLSCHSLAIDLVFSSGNALSPSACVSLNQRERDYECLRITCFVIKCSKPASILMFCRDPKKHCPECCIQRLLYFCNGRHLNETRTIEPTRVWVEAETNQVALPVLILSVIILTPSYFTNL